MMPTLTIDEAVQLRLYADELDILQRDVTRLVDAIDTCLCTDKPLSEADAASLRILLAKRKAGAEITMQLTAEQQHMLLTVHEMADRTGWATVSKSVFRLFEDMPKELVVLRLEGYAAGGRVHLVRLTDKGRCVIDAMPWLIG